MKAFSNNKVCGLCVVLIYGLMGYSQPVYSVDLLSAEQHSSEKALYFDGAYCTATTTNCVKLAFTSKRINCNPCK